MPEQTRSERRTQNRVIALFTVATLARAWENLHNAHALASVATRLLTGRTRLA